MGDKHLELQKTAINWLYYNQHCSIFANEVPTENGVADALGMKRTGETYYIECKASRADLICKKQRAVYACSMGWNEQRCSFHSFKMPDGRFANDGWYNCERCKFLESQKHDTGIDYYYVMVADGVTVEPALYLKWGVLDERGKVIRRAKRMPKNHDKERETALDIAHVLVYKVYGKMYLPAAA